jgi:hypothetical protein
MVTMRTMVQLRKVCRTRGWSLYSGLNARDLRYFVRSREVIGPLVRYIRVWLRCKRSMVLVNTEDIFTTEIVGNNNVFRLRGTNACQHMVYTFDAPSLLTYYLTEGKFENPFTRDPITDHDLIRLQRRYFIATDTALFFRIRGDVYILSADTDLVSYRHQITQGIRDMHTQEETRIYFRDRCQDALHAFYAIILDIPVNDVDAATSVIVYIVNYYIPVFFEHLEVLYRFDADDTKTYLATCIHQLAQQTCVHIPVQTDIFLVVFRILDMRYTQLFNTRIVTPVVSWARACGTATVYRHDT